MGPITASPVAFSLNLANFIDIGIDELIPSKALTRMFNEAPSGLLKAYVPDELVEWDYALTTGCAMGDAGSKEFADTEASYMVAFLEAVKAKYGEMEML
ncbi:hypothetical protein IFM47457_01607 [Aspergillus lentulus]|nr:hypothetical protein IFM47457_01607 [Aspergillus lentulus]